MKSLYALLTYLLLPLYMFAQVFSYSHYDSKDGLGSATVYCVTQDKEGFLWFGTETGLTRFDGTHFRNFTEEDGTMDNDVIQVFADSKGRVWFSPFRKTVCYYYRGKIHNKNNDTLLSKLNLTDNVFQFAEDAEGNILLKETMRLHVITAGNKTYSLANIENKPIGYITLIAQCKNGGFWVWADDKIYVLHDQRFTLWKTVEYKLKHYTYAGFSGNAFCWRNTPNDLTSIQVTGGRVSQIPFDFKDQFVNMAMLDSRYLGVGLQAGALVYDLENMGPPQRYLPGVTVSNMFRDSENNLWFCTLGKGVYRLNSATMLNLHYTAGKFPVPTSSRYSSPENESKVIYRLIKRFAGLPNDQHVLPNFVWYVPSPLIYMLCLDSTDDIILGSRYFLQKLGPVFESYTEEIRFFSVKAICRFGNRLLAATEKNVVVIDPKKFVITDTIWNQRATCLFAVHDTVYIGTMNGLFQVLPGNKVHFLGEQLKALQNRIVAVTQDDNHIVWVATTASGLIGYRNGQVVKQIDRNSGLSNNICRILYYENGKLWVGTEKGLNKINVLQPGYLIQRYSTSDGLASDRINSVYVVNKKVFVGTSEGITFFDEEKIASRSRCDLQIIDVAVAGETYHPAEAPVIMPHEKNNIRFNYVGISYKSAGDIRYRYRLMGLDSVWRETRETFLSYPTLPSGDYELQLQAINKFDVNSKMLTVNFTVDKLLYERTWFRVLIISLFLLIVGAAVWLIVRRIRQREQEKTAFIKRINELEQLSRKAQMNPHFIFNSLNSIQQYVMDADLTGANKFISGFSRLIRQTLDFTSKPEISLEEELDYLTNYLDIEQTRLENAFSWMVDIDKNVDPTEHYIPPMILQPFVENSVRHGLRFRRDKAGMVRINVKLESDYLVCILEDNGVGRKAALQYKSISPINYQSKGMSLTADRITMFNKEHEQKITMQIDDLEDEAHNALGTRVTIHFPVL